MTDMETLAELDRLNLEPATKAQVSVLLESLRKEVKDITDQLAAKDAVLAEKDFKIQALTYELGYYKPLRFSPKTEALIGIQRDLFREDVDADLAAIAAELVVLEAAPGTTVATAYRPRRGRQPLPEHLPRVEHYHEPESCMYGQCGGALTNIRDDITELLDVEPAKFFVHRHLCPVGTSGPNMPAGPAKP